MSTKLLIAVALEMTSILTGWTPFPGADSRPPWAQSRMRQLGPVQSQGRQPRQQSAVVNAYSLPGTRYAAWGAGAGWQIISVRRLRSASARSPPMSRDGFPGSPGHVQAKATPQGPHSLVRRPRPWPINAVGCRRTIEGNEAMARRLRERNE